VRITGLSAFLLACLFSCQPFKYSPTDFNASNPAPEFNLLNLDRISGQDSVSRPRFRIAVLADTHLWYDELKLAVDRLNRDSSLDFIIVAGDFTKFGYADEYDQFTDIINRANAPVLIGIGNHDLQADGRRLFANTFGPTDFSFVYRGTKFVFFDDNARGIDCCVPDFDWLERELAGAGDSLRIVAVSHAPPASDQLDTAQSLRMAGLFGKYGVELSIHGHTHSYEYRKFYPDGVQYLVADDIGDRNYVVVTLDGDVPSVERIFF
jgi:3',5'-cyclic-AMP phosphodiesterase